MVWISISIQSYTKAERLDKEERERRKERTRVNHILTHDYYRNTKEKKYV